MTEPMRCDHGSPTKDGKIACMKSSGCDYQEFSDLRIPLMYCTRARGPVVAEQAPVCIHFNPDEPDWQCTYTDFCKFKGCSISEFPKYVERRYCKQPQQAPAVVSGIGFTKKAFLKFLQWYGVAFEEAEDGIYIRIPGDSMYLKFDKIYREHSPEHDAALLAQEREKWERELRVKCPYKFCIELSCIFYKPNISAGNKCSKGCIIYHQSEWDLSVAAQAREDVLKERIGDIELIIALCRKLRHQFPSDLSLQMSQEQAERELKKLELLRSEVGK